MSDTNKSYELLKPGLSYITERTSAFGYSDIKGEMQYLQPVSRYKAFNEIKRGEAVSVVTKQELEDRAISTNKWEYVENLAWDELPADPETNNVQLEVIGKEPAVVHDWHIYQIFDTVGDREIPIVKRVDNYYDNYIEDEKLVHTLNRTETTFYKTLELKNKLTFPLAWEELEVNYSTFCSLTGEEKEDWQNVEKINVYFSYEYNKDTDEVVKTVWAYNKDAVDGIMADPDPYVVQTNTKVHERTIGIAMEYAEGYGSIVHVQPYGKFIYDPKYENDFEEYYGGTEHEAFDHAGKEYNPGFTYSDVGKKVYIMYPDGDKGGHLTVDEELVSKHYHNIICLGYLTDAPQIAGEGKTEVEINISGDQRGLLEATQFEATLGESVVISRNDPIRVFAVGKESDTKFKARLCLTPQGNTTEPFKNTDFIAFQKMDGNTAIIYFTPGDFNIQGVIDDDDVAFLHMAKCYANIKEDGAIKTLYVSGFNDIQTTAGVANNINKLFVKDNLNVLSDAFKQVSGCELKVTGTFASNTEPYGYIDMESFENGGYYAMYISSGLRSKFDGSVTECHGSYENHGLAVLADIRVAERRDILGIYYGSIWDDELPKGYTTVFMRLGEFDVPEYSSQLGGNFLPGQEYYLGMNGRVVKYPYNQYDFVNKIGSVKYGEGKDLRFVVDIGSSTRHYNGDLPVGYMKPAVHAGTEYVAEYGFLLMDGVTAYPKEKPYDALYERLLGWFDRADVDIEGSNNFHVPAVSKMRPDDVEELDENGNTIVTQKQVKVPMQIKYLATGIYEEMPRIPFKRFFGRFLEDYSEKVEDDWTPVKCVIEECDITDIIDYGISEDGYTKPGLDNLDIHLFIDPNEDYKSGAHDWHEVREGFINWNNSTTFGYTWKIVEEEASEQHPYGCYKLVMEIGNSQGVAYVTSENQSPKKLNGCYYKLYVARREVFSRQFDIEKIYKDYLTNSVFTDETKTKAVLDKAVTGKAVIDAIENRHRVTLLVGSEDADIEIGKLDAPVGKLVLNTKSDLPIIASDGISLQNEKDNPSVEDDKQPSKVIFKDGVLKKAGDYNDDDIYAVTSGVYNVGDDEIPVVKQVRQHAEATIDNKPYASNYANKDNQHGKIHGMVFGPDGNVDASTLWGFIPKVSDLQSIVPEENINAYIPVSYEVDGIWERTVEGTTLYRDNSISEDILSESIIKGTAPEYGRDENGGLTTTNETEAVLDKFSTKYDKLVKVFSKGQTAKAIETLDMEKGTLSFMKANGTSILNGLTVFAGAFNSVSRSEYKRIHGELIRDYSLVSDTDLVSGSKHYSDEPVETTVKVDEAFSNVVADYKFAESTNKLKNILGSALQAAYEMPLAYWQYNTEKEWYKDRLGVIVQRVESVAKNITGKKYATATIGSLIVTSNVYGGNDISITLERQGKTKNVKITTTNGTDTYDCIASTVGSVENNKLVSFSGVADAELLIADEDFLAGNPYTVNLEGGSETGTERKLFDKLYDTNGDDANVTTPEAKASVIIDNLKVTAKEAGTDGNKISVSSKYTDDNAHYRITVFVNGEPEAQYLGRDIDELHTMDSTEENPVEANDKYVEFSKVNDDAALTEFDNTFLVGGTDGNSVSQNLVNTDYKENNYQYTSKEAESIKEYLTTIIDSSSNGQDVLSTIGLLLNAAKETQERLLRVEASTFGRDYETIPGNHEPYVLTGMPGVVPDPTNYGLNRLIRAICQELYYDSNPFDSALVNGNTEVNTSSFSRIDRIDREIHGELNTEDSVQTAPNVLSSIDSSTYPYEDMIRAKDDTEIREAEFTMEDYDELAKARGTNVKTRVDMSLYNKDTDGDYTKELEGNTAEKSGQFNGIVDAIYRITTKLNALTESINNSDNIADSPKRLNTIRQNIEHIIREAYFDDAYVIDVEGEVEKVTPGEDKRVETFENHNRIDAEPYHDVNGPANAPYTKNVSRFDKLTDDLYNYSISVSGEGHASFQNFYELGDEKVLSKTPVRNPETGEVELVDTEKQVYYTGRKFNGKHLLVDNKPETDGTEAEYTTEIHIPQNLNDYNYATLLDIVVDAIGAEFFRKNVTPKISKDNSWNNREELRHNRTISTRLDNIEACLDKVVSKLSRKHSFEEETDAFYIQEGSTSTEPRTQGNKGVDAQGTVFSIDRYLQFLNDYLGYSQTTDNNLNFGKTDFNQSISTNAYTETYTEHWENGYDYKIENAPNKADSSGIDGNPEGKIEYSAEWALVHKRNIHAGLVNMLSRIQNEETRSSRYDAILGDDFKSTAVGLKTVYQDFGVDGKNGESDFQTRTSTVAYNLTDDIADLLKTIYGKDNHDTEASHENGSFTDFKHRTIIKGYDSENSNVNTRFVKDYAYGQNIIDIMIHDMYLLPQPLRPYDVSLGDTDTKIASIDYLDNNKATNYDKNVLFLPTDNELLMNETTHSTRDSRLAKYYDFDCGINTYDIPDSENALSWNNREEFFNETGRFTDSELGSIESTKINPHARLSRFEVLENEIRKLRKLIGLDFPKWDGQSDLVDLKFNGVLKFYGDRLNNGFSGNPFGTDVGASTKSYTDQFNQGGGNDGTEGATTNILKFILNADKSERLLRTELGFSNGDWGKVNFGTETGKNTGFWFWYDNTYKNTNAAEPFVSSNLEDVAEDNPLEAYGLYKQNHDATYMYRHSVYDRILALEKNAVQVDAWLDSIKNTYHDSCGKGTGTGNIFDILSYIGNYTWNNNDKMYYGKFGKLDLTDLRLSEKDQKTKRFDTVTKELNGHHDALKEIFDIIGTDANAGNADDYVKDESRDDKERSIAKKNTLWARLNEVEKLNQHDLDITNVITTNYTDEAHTEKGLVKMTDGKNGYTELKPKLLDDNSKLANAIDDWIVGANELIASKGYVDNAIVVAINQYAATVDIGDEVYANVCINNVNINDVGQDVSHTEGNATVVTKKSCNITDEKSPTSNPITFVDKKDHKDGNVLSLDKQDYYNAETIEKLVEALNMLNEKNQSNVNNLYKNVSQFMTALQYNYDDKGLVPTTTGSLLKFEDSSTTPDGDNTPTELPSGGTETGNNQGTGDSSADNEPPSNGGTEPTETPGGDSGSGGNPSDTTNENQGADGGSTDAGGDSQPNEDPSGGDVSGEGQEPGGGSTDEGNPDDGGTGNTEASGDSDPTGDKSQSGGSTSGEPSGAGDNTENSETSNDANQPNEDPNGSKDSGDGQENSPTVVEPSDKDNTETNNNLVDATDPAEEVNDPQTETNPTESDSPSSVTIN